jgi:flavin reductase (DIM6/NTAB) family NADH-FMN oxidoreductase RutF
MTEDIERFRHVMGHFATGVTVVTRRAPGRDPVGLTANAVASVSLEPRLLLVCMDRGSSSLSVLLDTGRFGISVLRAEDAALARRFSEEIPDERFRDMTLRESAAGVPVLAVALAWIGCRVWRTVEAGDHLILIGEVVDSWSDATGRPLVFFRGRFGTVE